MADLCNFAFTGRLGQDAQIKATPNGKTYMEMSVAVNTGYGNYKKTLWVKVKQWGERVNNIAGIFTKGAIVAGNGEVSINEWTGKDGTAHADLEVTCMNVQILSSKKQDSVSNEPDTDEPEDPVF
jgi:single-strand DNA-binding protein